MLVVPLRSLLAMLLVTHAASADCPTGKDLEDGIRLMYADGSVQMFQAKSDHIVQATHVWPTLLSLKLVDDEIHTDEWSIPDTLNPGPTEAGHVRNLVHGALDTRMRTFIGEGMNASGWWAWSLIGDIRQVPEPQANTLISLEFDVINEPIGWKETRHFSFGAEAPVQIGGCTYDAIPFEIRFQPFEAFSMQFVNRTVEDVEHHVYIPELRISYMTRRGVGEFKHMMAQDFTLEVLGLEAIRTPTEP